MDILIIAKNKSMQELLSRAFCYNGYRLSAASDGGSGLLQFGLNQPDLVIHDLDGCETLRRIRDLSSVPVIALVDGYDEKAKIECLDSGADLCITKPVSIPLLQAKVRALLRRSMASSTRIRQMESVLSMP